MLYKDIYSTFTIGFRLALYKFIDYCIEHKHSPVHPFTLLAYLKSTIIFGRPCLIQQHPISGYTNAPLWVHYWTTHPLNLGSKILWHIVYSISLIHNACKEEEDILIFRITKNNQNQS